MKYSKFIGSNNNFQTSVNLQYDLNKDEKIKGYIPTTQSLSILKRYLNSVCNDNNNEDNATVLIGPYGRGKSHLLLVLSAILSRSAESNVITDLTDKLTDADTSIGELLKIFHEKNKPYLPIIINSNHTDINQSFIIALREALERNDLNDFFPETYFDSALKMINTWENDFENAIKLFRKELRSRKIKYFDFKNQLSKCSATAYQTFCSIYPVVSNGANFNPLQNTDVVKMYDQVCDALIQQKSFGGVYIIFDEFSKFLESSAAMTNMQNLKLIQDFAEIAVRSNKMHLCCITHKEILDYSQSDSFRTVDGRFKKVYFVASSEQSYELVSNAITHCENFDKFYTIHKNDISSVTQLCQMTGVFNDLSDEMYTEILERKCFPIHPLSVFSLIRISELVGQNERTLFTFLSQSEEHSFQTFLKNYPKGKEFALLTPEWIYDYFADLFRVEVFNPKVHSIWAKTLSAIRKCENEEQIKLIKILAICKIIASDIFRATDINLKAASNFSDDVYRNTIDSLASLHIITRRRDGIYEFLTANGVDIKKNIQNIIEQGLVKLDRPHTLKEAYSTPFILPRQHNARMHIQRYFVTEFMEASDFWKYTGDFNEIKGTADGLLIYLISDEPYRELAYDGVQVPYLTKYYDNTIVGYSYSKSLSLPGERIGYLVIPDEADGSQEMITAAAIANRTIGSVNAPSLIQKVIAKCVDAEVDVAAYDKNRLALYNGLKDLGFECIKPEGAFYLFVKSPVADEKEFCEAGKKYNILMVPGSSFACPGYVRLAYCVSYDTIINSLPQFAKLAKEFGLA